MLSDYLSSSLQVRRNVVLGNGVNQRTISLSSVSKATKIMEHNGAELHFLSFHIEEQNKSFTPHRNNLRSALYTKQTRNKHACRCLSLTENKVYGIEWNKIKSKKKPCRSTARSVCKGSFRSERRSRTRSAWGIGSDCLTKVVFPLVFI